MNFQKIKKYSFFLFLCLLMGITVFLFFPYFSHGKVPFQSNFMVSFFAPWNTGKFPGWEHGIPNKPIGLDNLNLFYPYKQFSIELLKQGSLPLWNPYNFAGNVLMADFQSAIFYPLNFIYLLLPMMDAWSIMVLVQPFLAGIFTYVFLSTQPLGKGARMFGAFTWAFSGAMIVWMGDHLVVSHTMLWLPLILFGIEKYFITGKKRYWLVAILALVSALCAGFAQPFAYVFGLSLVYAIFRLWSYKKYNKIPMVASLFLFALGIGAIQLVPTWEVFRLSPRGTTDVGYLFDQYLMPFSHLISFLAPDYLGNPATYNFLGIGGYHESILFIGIVPFLFALHTFWYIRKNRFVAFYWCIALGSLAFGLSLPGIKFLYQHLPILSTFIPSRIFFVTSFVLAILAAYGWDEFASTKRGRRLMGVTFGSFGVLVLWMAYTQSLRFVQMSWLNHLLIRMDYVNFSQILVMQKNLTIPLMVFMGVAISLWIYSKYKMVGLGLLFFITVAGQLYFGQKYLSFNERQFVYPEHPILSYLQQNAGLNRFWTYGDGYINANFTTQYRVYSPDGTDALFPSRLGEIYFATETKGKVSTSIPRIDARIARAPEGEFMETNTHRLRLLSLLGVKYITDWTKPEESPSIQQQKFPASLFSLVFQKDGWHIYDYKMALPRAFLATDYIVEKNPQKLLDRLFDPATNLAKTIILEEQPAGLALEDSALQQIGTASISAYSPNHITIHASAGASALLFLSDTYFPGWKAFIDGKQAKIYRANYAFRAVVVPVGRSTVEFRYEPGSLRWGIMISLGSISLMVLVVILKRK